MKQYSVLILALTTLATALPAFSATGTEHQVTKQAAEQNQLQKNITEETETIARKYIASRDLAAKSGIKVGHYLLHGNGTVSDEKTELMWKRCSEGLSGTTCSGKLGWYTWESALQQATAVNRVGFGGYSDWRLPTIKELQSILEKQNPPKPGAHRIGFPKPKIDTRAFPRTANVWYWSASTWPDDRAYAWAVYFGGYTLAGPKDEAYCVRLVRDKK